MSSALEKVWEQQRKYNEGVFTRQQRSKPEWMTTYLLGLLSEGGQLLDSLNWKHHRLTDIAEFSANVPQELADLTKYVFSMWLLMGYTPEQMLKEVYEKGELLEFIYQQDFNKPLPHKVVIFDLDDTLADLRGSLTEFVRAKAGLTVIPDSSLHVDIDAGLPYDEYRILKTEFEQEGGYATLKPLLDVYCLFRELHYQGVGIVVYTARPDKLIKRVISDTYRWFKQLGAMPDVIKFGRDERLTYAMQLKRNGHKVVLVDDNPTTLKRAEIDGILTLSVSKPLDAMDYERWKIWLKLLEIKFSYQEE